jgi:hypothetical protein
MWGIPNTGWACGLQTRWQRYFDKHLQQCFNTEVSQEAKLLFPNTLAFAVIQNKIHKLSFFPKSISAWHEPLRFILDTFPNMPLAEESPMCEGQEQPGSHQSPTSSSSMVVLISKSSQVREFWVDCVTTAWMGCQGPSPLALSLVLGQSLLQDVRQGS